VVTYQFPQDKPNDELLILAQPTAAQVLPKGQKPFSLRITLERSWFLWVILLMWVGLIAWFVIAQIISRRK
jgi:putative exporter of polyketide antibiotics